MGPVFASGRQPRTIMRMSFDRLIESRIKDAMDAGKFANLSGEGRPLKRRDNEELAGDDWMGFHVLQNANLLPAWLELAKDIENDLADLAKVDRRHMLITEAVREAGLTDSRSLALRAVRFEYETLARKIRAKQDQFNLDAPAIIVERPGIWVGRRLEKLDERAEAASAESRVAAVD